MELNPRGASCEATGCHYAEKLSWKSITNTLTVSVTCRQWADTLNIKARSVCVAVSCVLILKYHVAFLKFQMSRRL